jgi:hypothetical protein
MDKKLLEFEVDGGMSRMAENIRDMRLAFDKLEYDFSYLLALVYQARRLKGNTNEDETGNLAS